MAIFYAFRKDIQLKVYSGTIIRTAEVLTLRVKYKILCKTLDLHNVKERSQPIMGGDWITSLNIFPEELEINILQIQNTIKKFPSVFSRSLGTL